MSNVEDLGKYNKAALGSRKFSLSSVTATLVVALIDFALIIIASIASDYLYQLYFYDGGGYASLALATGIVAGSLFVFQARMFGLYKFACLVNPGRDFGRIAVVWIASILAVTALFFLFRVGAEFSRGAISAFAASALGLLCLWRVLAARALYGLIEREAISGRRVVIIGEEMEMTLLSPSALLMQFGLKELARFSLGGGARQDALSMQELSMQELMKLDSAVAMARERRAEELVIAFDELCWKLGDGMRTAA